MDYAFLLEFSFDDAGSATYAFLVEPALAARNGLGTATDAPNRESAMDWLDQVREELEERFSSVHDVSGTEDEHAYIDGFSLYESTREEARQIASAWHEAFQVYLGDGVSGMVAVSRQPPAAGEAEGQADVLHASSSTASAVVAEIRRLLGEPLRQVAAPAPKKPGP